jgi:hypothetical protein
MIVRINGPFGVGKSTTASRVSARIPRWRLFDPETVGQMLRANLDGFHGDFQDIPAWRRLVPVVASQIVDHAGDDLIAVQTVLRHEYWRELMTGCADHGLEVVHVVLDVDEHTLRTRISEDEFLAIAVPFRLDHVEAYLDAREWMFATAHLVVDTTALTPEQVASCIIDSLGPLIPTAGDASPL